ncbi:MAG: trypsin-like peptidase domain-containing protein [Candidatus Dojkabacteria bacterium]|nr:MAG: trypsin-like peptidase domain-containing protein [Candidatus Dojkabacteria bacterium]
MEQNTTLPPLPGSSPAAPTTPVTPANPAPVPVVTQPAATMPSTPAASPVQPATASMAGALPPLPTDSKNKYTPTSKVSASRSPLAGALPKLFVAILLLAAIGIPIAVIVQSNLLSTQRSADGTIVVDTDNQDVKNALSKQLVYAEGGTKEYYSPNLDLLLTYSADRFSVSDSSRSVLISPYGNYEVYASLELPDKGRFADLYEYYSNYYTSIYKSTQLTEKVENEGVTSFTITYFVESITQPGVSTEYKVTVLTRREKDTDVAIVIKRQGTAVVSDAVLQDYTAILKSVVIKPEGLEANIVAQIKDAKATISFDRTMWTVNSQTESSLSLAYLSKNSSNPSITVGFSAATFRGFKEMSALEERMQKDIEFDRETYKDKEFKLLEDKAKQTINGVEFIRYTMSYVSSGYLTTRTVYLGFSPATSSTMQIRVSRMEDNDKKGDPAFAAKDLEALIGSLQFEHQTSANPFIPALAENGSGTLAQGGITTDDAAVLGASTTSTLTIEKAALMGKTATVRVFARVCSNMKVSMPDILPTASRKTYQICTAGFGTGFFVHEDGVIVTNAHVAAPNSFDTAMDAFNAGNDAGFAKDVLTDVARAYIAKYPLADLNDPTVQKQITSVASDVIAYGLVENKITAERTSQESYIQGEEPFDIDATTLKPKDPTKYLKAELVQTKELESYYEFLIEQQKAKQADASAETKEFTVNVPDLALLKISAPQGKYPTLQLGNYQTITEGSTVYAIGFPSLANNKTLFADDATTIPTITKGTVSAVKPSANSQFKLVQVDATISPGNSGGPIVNNDGRVIAVSTYGISGRVTDKNYNAGVSVEELSKFIAEQNISNSVSTVSTTFASGLDNLTKGYYQWAIRDLEAAKAAYAPIDEITAPLILLAQEKINNGEDNTPIFEISGIYIHRKDLPFILGGVGAVVVILILLFIIGLMSRRGKKPSTPQPAAAMEFPAPTPTTPLTPSMASVTTPIAPAAQPTISAADSGFIAQQPKLAETAPTIPSTPAVASTPVTEPSSPAMPASPVAAPTITPQAVVQPDIAPSSPSAPTVSDLPVPSAISDLTASTPSISTSDIAVNSEPTQPQGGAI